MRNVFLVGAKLLGILALYWAIIILPQICLSVSVRFPDIDLGCVIGGWMLSFSISLLFAIFLLFKTERIANILSIYENREEILKPTADQLLVVGIILIGIFLISTALPKLTETFFSFYSTDVLRNYHIKEIVTQLLQIFIGGFLIFSAKRINHYELFWIKKEKSKFDQKPSKTGEGNTWRKSDDYRGNLAIFYEMRV